MKNATSRTPQRKSDVPCPNCGTPLLQPKTDETDMQVKTSPMHESLLACFASPGQRFVLPRSLFGRRTPERIRDLIYTRATRRNVKVSVRIDEANVRLMACATVLALKRNALRKALRRAYLRLDRSVGTEQEILEVCGEVRDRIEKLQREIAAKKDGGQ